MGESISGPPNLLELLQVDPRLLKKRNFVEYRAKGPGNRVCKAVLDCLRLQEVIPGFV